MPSAAPFRFASSFEGMRHLRMADPLKVGYFSEAIQEGTQPNKTRLVTTAEGNHAFPSRTRPLSPPAPMVLGPQGPGRVGRCQAE